MAYQALIFQDDAASLIDEAEQNLLSLEQNPGEGLLICNCAKFLRTIRGVADLFNLDNVTRLTALAADGLDASSKGDQGAPPELIGAAIEFLAELRQTAGNDLDARTTHNLTATLAPFASKPPSSQAGDRTAAATKILVVDDEHVNRVLLEEFIVSFNKDIQITSVESAAEAIYYYITEDFDLVFLDIMMPDIDGNQFLAIIEKNRAQGHLGGDANIVVQTGVQSLQDLLAIVRKDSVLEVIRKPLLRERICTCIERYCPAFQH